MVFRKTFSGKETYVPQQFAPSAGEAELVARIGVYDDFASDTTINVAWGQNTDPFSGVYDKRNILIHHIKVTNEDFDKQKEVHFWQNDDATRVLTGAGSENYMFDIPMAITKDDADGRVDTVIDFPIPLLIMGGCRIGLKQIAGASHAYDYCCRVEICYSVLDGTADSADFDALKYQYLSAFSSFKSFSNAEYAIQPNTVSTPWVEDIEIWGGMIMNYQNASDDVSEVAKSYVQNADGVTIATISVIKGPKNAFTLNYPVGIQWPTYSGAWSIGSFPGLTGGSINWPLIAPTGYSISFPTLTGGSLPTFISIDWGHVIWANPNTLDKAKTDGAVSTANLVLKENDTDYDDINVGDVVQGTGVSGAPTIVTVTDQTHVAMSSSQTIGDDVELTFMSDNRKTWSLKAAGSDTQITFYPYPVYCKGNEAGANNFRVFTGASSNNATRVTWFYRPVNAQGVDHGWV